MSLVRSRSVIGSQQRPERADGLGAGVLGRADPDVHERAKGHTGVFRQLLELGLAQALQPVADHLDRGNGDGH